MPFCDFLWMFVNKTCIFYRALPFKVNYTSFHPEVRVTDILKKFIAFEKVKFLMC